MYSSQEIEHSPLQNNQRYRRFFKYQTTLNSNSNKIHSSTQKQTNTNKIIPNSGLHLSGKINFHQLLSIPLEKQILKQNSLKENQTFFLKFEPQQIKNSRKTSSKAQNIKKKPQQKLINFNEQRSNIRSEKSGRISLNKSKQKSQQLPLRQASKTVYFKPLGKILSNSSSQQIQARGSQFQRSRHMYKSNEQNPVQIVSYGYRDKLLMLLQIRRQQQSERKNVNVRQSFSKYGNKTGRQFYSGNSKQKMMLQKDCQQNRRSFRLQSNDQLLKRFRRNYPKQIKMRRDQQQNHNHQPSPWQLVEHVDEF